MIYKSNLSDVLNKLKVTLLSPQKQDELTREIATTMYADNIDRVFKKGFNVNNRLIGQYSHKPIYVNPKKSPKKFSPKGKNGTKKSTVYRISTKKGHKVTTAQTRYFDKGYWEFRGFIGRENSHVNLDLTHRLKTEFRMVKIEGGWALGFTGIYGDKLSRAHEERYSGEIWGLTQGNLKQIDKIVNDFINAQVK